MAVKFDLNTVTAAVNVLGDAIKDTSNALGDKADANRVQDFGNMVPDLTSLAVNAGVLPKAVEQIEPAVAQTLTEATAAKLSVPHPTAQTVIQRVLDMLGGIVEGLMGNAQGIAAIVKGFHH